MEDSLILKTTMSPRIPQKYPKNPQNREKTKATKLSLRKSFRRSSIYDKLCPSTQNSQLDLRDAVSVSLSYEITSSNSSCNSDLLKNREMDWWKEKTKKKVETIIISDSDGTDFSPVKQQNKTESNLDRDSIKKWIREVNDVNNVLKESLEGNLEKKMADLEIQKENSDKIVRKSEKSNKNLGKTTLEYKEQQNDDLENSKVDDVENLLDSLYGNSWRANKDDVLQSGKKQPPASKKDNSEKSPQENDTPKRPLISNLRKSTLKSSSHSSKSSESSDFETISHSSSSSEQHLIDCFKKTLSIKKDESERSFLASLSKTTPLHQCNPRALIYRNNYQKHKERLAKELFDLFNSTLFANKIPSETPIEWNSRLRGTAGKCHCLRKTKNAQIVSRTVKIQLSPKVLDSADRLRDTLVHEMCHAATFIVDQVNDGHGHFWQAWARKAMKTYPELPPIARCHNYAIAHKFTYKCTKCGYSFGRHSKSLDLERKRCGICYGSFQLLVNKVSKSGEKKQAVAVAETPKKPPNAFALFVKENYKELKSPHVTHKEVMKALSERYKHQKKQFIEEES